MSLAGSSTNSATNENSVIVTFVPVNQSLPNTPWKLCRQKVDEHDMSYWCYEQDGNVNNKDVKKGGKVDLLGPDFVSGLHEISITIK